MREPDIIAVVVAVFCCVCEIAVTFFQKNFLKERRGFHTHITKSVFHVRRSEKSSFSTVYPPYIIIIFTKKISEANIMKQKQQQSTTGLAAQQEKEFYNQLDSAVSSVMNSAEADLAKRRVKSFCFAYLVLFNC